MNSRIRNVIQKVWKGMLHPSRAFKFIINIIDNNLMITEYARAIQKGERLVLKTEWEMAKRRGDFSTLAHLQRYEWVIKELRSQKVNTLLDMGCGSGYGTERVAKELDIPFVAGIDVSENAIEFASKHYHGPNLWFKKMDACALRFPREFFDVIISFDVLEHLVPYEQHLFLVNMSNVVKKSGVWYLGCPNAKVSLGGNVHHKHELYAEEFVALLNEYFGSVKLLCQDIIVDGERAQENWHKFVSDIEYHSLGIFDDKCENAFGLLAICTNPKETKIS